MSATRHRKQKKSADTTPGAAASAVATSNAPATPPAAPDSDTAVPGSSTAMPEKVVVGHPPASVTPEMIFQGCLSYCYSIFAMDPRSLVCMRVLLGLVYLFDTLYELVQDMDTWLVDGGLRHQPLYGSQAVFCLHTISGTWQYQAFIMSVQTIVGVCLVLGLCLDYVKPLAWVLHLSWQMVIGQMMLHGGDNVCDLLLFFTMFIPVNNPPWPALKKPSSTNKKTDEVEVVENKNQRLVLTPGTVGVIACFMYFYVGNALDKTGFMWQEDRSAVFVSLGFQNITTWLAGIFRLFPSICAFLTVATLQIELYGPIAWFLPLPRKYHDKMRFFVIFNFVAMHFGFILMFRLANFPYICIAGWLGMLPAAFWDEWLPAVYRTFRKGKSPTDSEWCGAFQAVSRMFDHPTTKYWRLRVKQLVVWCFVLTCAVASCGSRTPHHEAHHLMVQLRTSLRLWQCRGLFATMDGNPVDFSGWTVLVGVDNEGAFHDYYPTGTEAAPRALSLHPPSFADFYRTERWHKWQFNVQYSEGAATHFMNHVCAKHVPHGLRALQMYHMTFYSMSTGISRVEKKLAASRDCANAEVKCDPNTGYCPWTPVEQEVQRMYNEEIMSEDNHKQARLMSTSLKAGDRVRAIRSYREVNEGDYGTYLSFFYGSPPAQVAWDRINKTKWVHWCDLEFSEKQIQIDKGPRVSPAVPINFETTRVRPVVSINVDAKRVSPIVPAVVPVHVDPKRPYGSVTPTLVSLGQDGCSATHRCEECQGDCDSDEQCAEGLKCFLRETAEKVPGCGGHGMQGDLYGFDYCYNPSKPDLTSF